MKAYLKKIFSIFFYVFLFLSIPIDDLRSFSDENILNMDLGVETSLEPTDPSSFFDISSPFFYKSSDLKLDYIMNSNIISELSHDEESNPKYSDPYSKYLEIRDYSLALMRMYRRISDRNNVFVGIGSSPTPILAFVEGLKNLSHHRTISINSSIRDLLNTTEFINIPFSKSLIYYNNILPMMLKQKKNLTSEEIYLEFFKLFDKYSTDPSIFMDKNIIILDFTLSGISLFSFSRLFLRYLDYKNISYHSVHLHLIRMFPENTLTKKLSSLDNIRISEILKSYPILSLDLLESAFDEYRRYPDYMIKINEKRGVPVSQEYKGFVKMLMNYIKKDRTLVHYSCFNLFGK